MSREPNRKAFPPLKVDPLSAQDAEQMLKKYQFCTVVAEGKDILRSMLIGEKRLKYPEVDWSYTHPGQLSYVNHLDHRKKIFPFLYKRGELDFVPAPVELLLNSSIIKSYDFEWEYDEISDLAAIFEDMLTISALDTISRLEEELKKKKAELKSLTEIYTSRTQI